MSEYEYLVKILVEFDSHVLDNSENFECRMYLDCAPEHTDDEDVTSGSVDCDDALQCEVDQVLLQYFGKVA